MNNSNEMIKNLKDFLENKGENYYKESITFKGLRKKVPQQDGSEKDLYVISYLVSLSNLKYDSDGTFYAYFDEKSEKLLYIIGPQSYENFEK